MYDTTVSMHPLNNLMVYFLIFPNILSKKKAIHSQFLFHLFNGEHNSVCIRQMAFPYFNISYLYNHQSMHTNTERRPIIFTKRYQTFEKCRNRNRQRSKSEPSLNFQLIILIIFLCVYVHLCMCSFSVIRFPVIPVIVWCWQ